MIWLGYLTLVAALWWAGTGRSTSISALGPRGQVVVRICTGTLALLFAVGALLVLPHAEPSLVGDVVGVALLGGSALYLTGVVAWFGRAAYHLRFAGWCLLVAPLAVPSTLTLALPLAAVLVVSLAPVYSARARPSVVGRH